jgi:hypothetical protein
VLHLEAAAVVARPVAALQGLPLLLLVLLLWLSCSCYPRRQFLKSNKKKL